MTPHKYTDKIVIVTGSRRGVGKSISEYFLNNGATVLGFARGEKCIASPNYHHFQVDLGKPEEVMRVFQELNKQFEHLDIAINNAGVLTSQYSMIMPASAAQEMLNVNLLGPFMVSREAAKIMKKQKWGRIINISSMAESLEPMGDSIYAASKAGLKTLTHIMAKEFASMNITCNTLAINAIESDMLAQLSRDKIEAIIAGLPIPRMSQPDDIFNIIDFFVSERSSSITAQTIYLGGVHSC